LLSWDPGIFSQALNDVSSSIPGQDLGLIGLKAASELLDLLGPALFCWHRDYLSRHHLIGEPSEKRRAKQIEQFGCRLKADEAKILPRDRTAYIIQCLGEDTRIP